MNTQWKQSCIENKGEKLCYPIWILQIPPFKTADIYQIHFTFKGKYLHLTNTVTSSLGI